MLCVISVGAHGLVCIGGWRFITFATGIALVLGLTFFPTSPNMGFLPGVWAWGSFCYGAGFLIRTNKSSRLLWTCVGVLALAVFIRAGWAGWAKVLPVILLGAMYWLKLDRWKFLHPLGEASGTVYIYHQPFLLQGLLIGVSVIPVWQLQVAGVLGAASVAILICSLYYFAVRNTWLKFTLGGTQSEISCGND
jgi:acyltransferase